MNRLQQLAHKTKEDEINRCMRILKSYEEDNPNDITGLLSGMASFLYTYSASKPVLELSKHLQTLSQLLEQFPFDVNEHSKAIESLATIFVLSMESLVESGNRDQREKKVAEVKGKKDWEFVPSHTQHTPSRYPQTSSHGFERTLINQSQYQPPNYPETWEENTMDMHEFDLNQPRSSLEGREWEEDMPILEGVAEERYKGGLRARGGGDRRREERRYEGGLRGTRNLSTSPSKNVGITSRSDHRFIPIPQKRIMINKNSSVKVAVVRKGLPIILNKIDAQRLEPAPKREGASMGLGKANAVHDNNILTKLCPKSAMAQREGVDGKGSSFISRSRARTSGLMKERDISNLKEDGMDGKTISSLEETVVESRKKELTKEFHDGRLMKRPVEATYNTNLSETWWALEARKGGPSLLSNRLKRAAEKKIAN